MLPLADGHYAGDISLLWGVKSPFTIITETSCQLYCVDRRAFEELLMPFPDLVSKMKKEAYKCSRRWGISAQLRDAAVRGEHASSFTRVSWDWDAAEAELRAEAEANGESLDPPDDLFTRDWSAMRRQRADSRDVAAGDVFSVLRRGLGKAGDALKKLPQELQHLPELLAVQQGGGGGGGGGGGLGGLGGLPFALNGLRWMGGSGGGVAEAGAACLAHPRASVHPLQALQEPAAQV